jgi:hypothetical protein
VDQVEVDVVEPEPLERRLERALRLVFAGRVDEELGRDEDGRP